MPEPILRNRIVEAIVPILERDTTLALQRFLGPTTHTSYFLNRNATPQVGDDKMNFSPYTRYANSHWDMWFLRRYGVAHLESIVQQDLRFPGKTGVFHHSLAHRRFYKPVTDAEKEYITLTFLERGPFDLGAHIESMIPILEEDLEPVPPGALWQCLHNPANDYEPYPRDFKFTKRPRDDV